MITRLPAELGRMTTLSLLDIEHNNLLFPPRHINSQGKDVILAFLRKSDSGKVEEGRFATELQDRN